MKTKRIPLAEVSSIQIIRRAEQIGLSSVELLGENGKTGDERLRLFEIAGVRVLETNAAPCWEGEQGFDEAAASCQ